jgi:hypothetical protein
MNKFKKLQWAPDADGGLDRFHVIGITHKVEGVQVSRLIKI